MSVCLRTFAPAAGIVALALSSVAAADIFDERLSMLDTVPSAELDGTRGRNLEPVQLSTLNTTGTVTGNSAENVRTGDNILAGHAFGNAAGFVSVIQNSGNNVLIQESTVINVSIGP